MSYAMVTDWVEGYKRAWTSNDPDDIRALFTAEARYYTAPFRDPWEGMAEILAGWKGRADHQGTWSFEYEVLSESGGLGVVQGVTHYRDQGRDYSNLWLVWLDDDGRCTRFVEYWMLQEET